MCRCIRHAEYNGTKFVEQVETEQAGNMTAFELAKGMLLSDVQGGMNIRLFVRCSSCSV